MAIPALEIIDKSKEINNTNIQAVHHLTINEKLELERQRRIKAMDFIDRPMPRWKFILHCAWMIPTAIGGFGLFIWLMAAAFPWALPH